MSTPIAFYHRVWALTGEYLYEKSKLLHWNDWEHKFDSIIHTHADAVAFAKQMLASIGDPYTFLVDPKEEKKEQSWADGKGVGVGISFGRKRDAHGKAIVTADASREPRTDTNGYPIVAEVAPESPAEKVGIRPGAVVMRVGSIETRGLSIRQVKDLIDKQPGSFVTIEFLYNDQTSTVQVECAEYSCPAVTFKILVNHIGYVRLQSLVQSAAAEEFAAALESLAICPALIVDLRNNPGGNTLRAEHIASMFLDKGKLITISAAYVSKTGTSESWTDLDSECIVCTETRTDWEGPQVKRLGRSDYYYSNLTGDKPVVVLVDRDTGSAAEMLTAILKENSRVIVVGEPTVGKGVGQIDEKLPFGYTLHVTALRYFTPNGNWLGDGYSAEAHGLVPDILIPAAGDFRQQGDTQLQAALTHLSSQLQMTAA